jgi:SAM-dependent methyltransferase
VWSGVSSGGEAVRGVHASAAVGFQAGAEAYERGRPGFPEDAIAALARECGIEPGRWVVDLAAGTGKLTRQLVGFGADLVAVEPVEGMRRVFAERLPRVPVLDGTAESLPFEGGSVDAVVASQAFHWFDPVAAPREIHRVLSVGGALGLVWNVRDENVPWVARLTELMEPYRGDTPSFRTGNWRRGLDDSGLFSPLLHLEFAYEQEMTVDGLVDRTLSVSFMAALPEDQRATVGERLRRLAETDPDLGGRETFPLPYRTDVYVGRARSR